MSGMEDGFLAVELAIIGIILLMTGWNKELAGGAGWKQALLVISVCCVLSLISLQVTSSLSVNGSILGLAALCAYLWVFKIAAGDRLYLLGCSLLLGLLQVWLDRLYHSSPMFIVIRSGWDMPILCGILAALLTLPAANQLVLLVSALLVAVIVGIWLPDLALHTHLGSAMWWDGFAAGAAACRLAALIVGAVICLLKRLALQRWNNQEGDA